MTINQVFPHGVDAIVGNDGVVVHATQPPSKKTGQLNLLGSGGVTVSYSGNNTVAISGSSTGITWSSISSNQALSSNHGYIVTSGSLVLSLPATAAIGDQICIISNGAASCSWQITLGGGLTIKGITTGTQPVTYLNAVTSGNSNNTSVVLICSTANTGWTIQSLNGSLTGS